MTVRPPQSLSPSFTRDSGLNLLEYELMSERADALGRHGLKVEVKRIPASDVDVANAVLSYAADSAAEFVVMGGYGHSRFREMMLGGVTRTMLERTTVPVLFSH